LFEDRWFHVVLSGISFSLRSGAIAQSVAIGTTTSIVVALVADLWQE